MNRRIALSTLAAIAVIVAASQCAAAPSGLQAAVQVARMKSMPMLVLGTADTCGPCISLRKELQSRADLQPLVSQYVCIDLKVGTPDFRAWTTQHAMGRGTPMMWIIGPDGKEIYAQPGAVLGDGLKKLLEQGLAQLGKNKTLAGKTTLARRDPKPSHPKAVRPAAPPKEAVVVDSAKRARSFLAMAQSFADKRPEMMKKYARKVIEVLPDSPEADEARKLLDQ